MMANPTANASTHAPVKKKSQFVETMKRLADNKGAVFGGIIFLLILGVDSLRNFALPIMVGVISGCYSSVCVAGPLWNLLKGKKNAVKVR